MTLLSWDTDGDGVVEFHEVVGAFKAYAKVFYSLLRRRKNVKSGLDGRTIEWRAALYGVLDVLAKVDDPNPNQTLTRRAHPPRHPNPKPSSTLTRRRTT